MSQTLKKQLLAYSEKLLSLTTRNKLIHSSFSSRDLGFRFIDELPQKLAYKISNTMRFSALPPLTTEPPEERTLSFKRKVEKLKLIDEFYLQEIKSIDERDLEDPDEISELEADALRNLKDRLRKDLDLPPRVFGRGESDLRKHAQNHKIDPSYDLPKDNLENQDIKKFNDLEIQTLMLPDVLNAKLMKLRQQYKTNLEETGQNTLYLCFGFLQWTQTQGLAGPAKKRLAPLLMMQVKFNLDTKTDLKIQAVDENEILENKTLQLYLENEFGIKLPKAPILQIKNGKKEYEVLDIEKYILKVQAVADKAKKDWKVLRRASVGIFHTQELTMHEDLKSISENPNGLLKKLLSGKSISGSNEVYEVDQECYRKTIPALIEPADSSQHSAIIDMLENKSFVLRGPPGTGKSQTICNMIAAGMYSGKKILFVADKEAALEVVRTRLKAAGLDDYVLKLYSSKASKKSLWSSVKQRINIANPRSVTEKLDPKILELRKVRDSLNEYKDFIGSDFGKTGLKIHDLLWKQELLSKRKPLESLIEINFLEPENLKEEQKNKIVMLLNSIEQQFKLVFKDISYKNHPWVSAKKPPSNTIEKYKFNESIDLWANDFLEMKKTHEFLINIGFLEDNLVEVDLRKVSNLVDFLKLHSSKGELYSLLIFYFYLSDEKIAKIPSLINLVKDSSAKQSELNDSGLSTDDLTLVNQKSEYLLSYITNEAPLNSLERLIAEKQDNLSKIRISYMPYVQFFDNLNLEDSLSLDSIALINKLLFLVEDDNSLVSRTCNRFLDNNLKVKISLLKNSLIFRQALKDKSINVEYLEASSVLRSAALEIRSSSFFSFLNEDYRRANKILKGMSQDSLSKKEKVELLELAVSYKTIEESLSRDKMLLEIFNSELISQIKLTELEIVEKNFQKLSNLSPSETATSVFEILIDNPAVFIDYLVILKDSLKDLDIKELLLELKPTLKSESDIDSRIDLEEREVNEIEFIFNSLNKNLLNHSIIEINYFKELAKSLNDLEQDVLNKVDEVFGKKIPINVIKDNLQVLENWQVLLSDVDQELRETIVHNIEELIESSPSINTFAERLKNSIESLLRASNLIEASPFKGLAAEQISHEDLWNFLKRDQKSGPIDEFFDLKNEELELPLGPVKNFYDNFLSTRNSIDEIADYFESWVVQKQYRKLLEDKKNSNMLKEYRGKRLNSLVNSLKILDQEIQDLIRDDIKVRASTIGKNPPKGVGGKSTEKTEMELLDYGNNLKTYPKGTVRNHISRGSEALALNLPCWMVTPPNISTFVPLTQEFDLVIIDEASQMSPARALPAIARAKQCIIVGDENQLPPTSFFAKAEDDESDIIDIQESILDLAKTIWTKPRLLKWHYRSKHQDLIRFQNNFIYENSLIIPPSTFESEDSQLGVRSHYLENAIYRNGGTNEDEVNKIVELVIEHSSKRSDKSLGIAVMNVKQRDSINQELDLLSAQNSSFREFKDKWRTDNEGLNKFFVKNLENIQGDERDVIIMGTGFGRLKKSAPVLQRFHPLNQVGGERRLNVITTRARESLHLVTSLTSADVKTNSKGTKFLSEYIAYSKTKKLPLGNETGETPDSPFEDWAIGEIESMGFKAVPQVGVQGFKIDIGVKHPDVDGYILAIECDGATYHSSPAARDRDLLRQQLLESFGWKFHRIWSTDWIWETEKTAEKLRSAINKALIEAKEKNVHS